MRTIPAKQILSAWSRGESWFGCNYNMNIYKGCSHGCIYCDSRSECYRVDNFDEVRAKTNVLELLEAELASKRRKGIVGTGAMSDPYNPQEKKHLLTRGSLELLAKYGYGSSLLTKSDLVVRDIDLLKKINDRAPVVVKFTITTYCDELTAKLEPNVAPSSRRFTAMGELARAGIMTGVHLWPLLPFINDSTENIQTVVRAAAEQGASFVSPMFGVTLRQNQRLYFYQQLDRFFPGVQELYIKTYGNKYECISLNADKLWEVFRAECHKHGLLYKMADIRQAIQNQHRNHQLSFFD